ncbi:MAG: hypothetical protein KatS3mg121_1053 [Gammaproteobacteria bacterium]|nr:MAG: hypothetical protein KatS3mg121_1053 [Gammaproteobacteria bacterium]
MIDSRILFAAIAALLAGVGLVALLWPAALLRWNRRSAEKVSLPLDWLDRPIRVERWLYRRNRLAGALLLAAGAYLLWAVVRRLPGAPLPAGWREALLAGGALAAVLGLTVGLVVLLRPSALKPLERWSNRWIELPTAALDRESDILERWVAAHTRLFGAIVLAAAVLILSLLWAG